MKPSLVLAVLVVLAACTTDRETIAQRDALSACRGEADRALSARTRTDSLRNDERDARTGQGEFDAGTNQAADITGRERLIDDCLVRGTPR